MEARDLTAIALIVLAMAVVVFMDAIAKELVRTLPVFQIVAVRSWIILGLMVAWLPRMGGIAAVRTRRPGGHFLRGVSTAASVLMYFTALRYLPLADAVVIFFAAPFFIALLAILLFGEKVGPHRWAAIALGFLGVVIAMGPGPGLFHPAALLALGGALGYAVAMMMSRRLGSTESVFRLIFYQNLGNALFSTPIAVFAWHPLGWWDLMLVLILVVTALGGYYALTRAYATGTSSLIAPFEYTSLIWASLLGYLMFGEIPGGTALSGAMLVLLAGLYLLHREQRRKARRKDDQEEMG